MMLSRTRLQLILQRGALLGASFAFCFICCEAYLRATIKDESELIPRTVHYVPLAVERAQRRFLADYKALRGRTVLDAEFDKRLGWDIHPTAGRYRKHPKAPGSTAADVFRVVVAGDSYSYGSEVSDDETFPYFIEHLGDETDVINMGVPGYGIDQAVLKLKEHGLALQPDLVVLGVFYGDYRRTMVPFFFLPKPQFVIDPSNEVTLFREHIEAPGIVYETLSLSLPTSRCFTCSLIKNRLKYLYFEVIRSDVKDDYYERARRIVTHLLEQLRNDVERIDAKLLVVSIPPGGVFKENSNASLEGSANQIVREALGEICGELDIPHLDLASEWQERFPGSKVFSDFYVRHKDGSVGHLSRDGNREVAELIRDRIGR
jgi:hypothetical protein